MKYEKVGFFGAGFSKWCIELPLMKDLFDFKGDYWAKDRNSIDKLKIIYNNWKQRNKSKTNEHFITFILSPKTIRFLGITPNKKKTYSKILIDYLSRRLSEPFIWKEYHAGRLRRHTYNLQGSRKRMIPFINQPKEWLLNLDAIITTNYDLTLEYLLNPKDYNYGYQGETLRGRGDYPVSQYTNPVILSGETPLLKLHGSLSWTSTAHFTNGRGGITGEAVIIPPLFEKLPSKRFQEIWTQAEKILKKARKIIFFGFAFNPYDESINNLLSKNVSDTAKILIVDPYPNKKRIKNLFSTYNISYLNPLNKNNNILNEDIKNFLKS